MATLIRPLRIALFSTSKTLLPHLQQLNPISVSSPNKIDLNPPSSHTTITTIRNYITEMRNSAVHDYILRHLRNEMQYEFDRFPLKQPVDEFKSFKIDDRPGEQWITMKRKFANSEEIKLEVTMFDGSVPSPQASDVTKNNDILHLTFIVDISKGDCESLEIMCSGWPDSLEIKKLFIRRSDKMPAQVYDGPDFNELDDELQESLYEFLEERGVDDEMAAFLHQYMKNKERNEYIRWMGTVKSYIEEK
ncbi:uncharacterized protein At2g39795, mitochondrial-like [Euphorbia lathyris]|uniref:uncharacterized protein At2g39795, mitochondrial-like n=1 Tax=Euphorbia lathyris TaxID=212925 RepID=UPI003313D569